MHLLSLKNAFRARLPSKLHRQLLHQHHLQSHLQWGNDPRVANHNGIPSATHPPAPLATPFTMRERSYSCKSQWNSVDHKCTKHRWHPIYNAEPIREWSEHDPRMIRPHTRPSRNRRTAEVDHRGSGTDFVWKNIGFRASAISQKRISCETPHLQCGTDPRMIRAWSENDPTTHETVSQPSHRRGRSSRFGDGLCMENQRLSCICYLSKTHFVRDFLQNSIGNSSTSTTRNPIYSEGTISLTNSFPNELFLY